MVHLNIKHSGNQLLVVYGGRNDKIYGSTGNVALNDICVFNCNQSTWEPLAMFGQMPCSRWSHTMVAMSNTQSYHEGFLVFGGVNLRTYCKSNFFTFSFSHKKAGIETPHDKDFTRDEVGKLVPKETVMDKKLSAQKNEPSKILLSLSKSMGRRYVMLHENAREKIDILRDICSDP